jgi:hypothetical protein
MVTVMLTGTSVKFQSCTRANSESWQNKNTWNIYIWNFYAFPHILLRLSPRKKSGKAWSPTLLINRIRAGNERVSGPISRLSYHFFLIVAMVTDKTPVETVLPFEQRGKDREQIVFKVNVPAQHRDSYLKLRPTQYHRLNRLRRIHT